MNAGGIIPTPEGAPKALVPPDGAYVLTERAARELRIGNDFLARLNEAHR